MNTFFPYIPRTIQGVSVIIFLCLLFVPGGIIQADTQSSNYKIWADVFSVGGTESGPSANYDLQDSIGEALILSSTSTSSNYGVKAGFRELYPDQYISLSLGSGTASFGTLSAAAVASASHTMTIDTNAPLGYSIVVSGATLTSGGDTIDAIGGVAAASTPGTEQFGLNLVANTAPSVGAAVSGTAPIGAAVSPYATPNAFAYTSGSTVASATGVTNSAIFTVSYIVNIASATPAGTYTTTLTYAATANF